MTWRYCPTHREDTPEAWGCPHCVADQRQRIAELEAERKHCDECGGSWLDDGINSGCYCLRIKQAEQQLAEARKVLRCYQEGESNKPHTTLLQLTTILKETP